jgi:branched-chain amino acid transport system ATP-binding protein
MLELMNINAGYDGIQILWDVSLRVEKGEIVALVGANGAGKSTIIKTITGLIPPMSGGITFDGERIDVMPVHTIIRKGIALVPEGRGLFPYMTVKENLEVGNYAEKDRKKALESLEAIFGLFPVLKERRKQLAGTLSGGEQQMLTIGRALMSMPKFLMMDEPSLGLAPVIVEDVFETIHLLHNDGITILLVEQNVRKALEIAQRGYVLENGRIVKTGDSHTLLGDEEVKRAYLGI